MDFFGMDYKVATTIMQIFGYLISKFFAIKIVSELKRENRLKFMIFSVALAELALVFFGLLPQPFNVFALFFNGLALGCMWGVIFSFIEGRKVTDILASLLGVSMAVSSGMAKAMGGRSTSCHNPQMKTALSVRNASLWTESNADNCSKVICPCWSCCSSPICLSLFYVI